MFSIVVLSLALQAGGEVAEVQAEVDTEIAAEAVAETVVQTESQSQSAAMPAPIVIPRDTPVHLMVINEVSTKDHSVGHRFSLRVNKPVVVDGREVIPVGTTAWGELIDAEKSGNVGKRGSLSARLSHIDLGGKSIPIEGGTTSDGKSGKSETIMGVLAMGPLGLFAKGNNAKIKAGEMMTAFISEDVVLDHVD